MSGITGYSRENPSPRYQSLRGLYQQMHSRGETQSGEGSSELYSGRSLLPHLDAIRALVQETGARALLDYSSGKGAYYRERNLAWKNGIVIPSIGEYLGVEQIACFDLGFPEFSVFPSAKFDGVISRDVLGHCPEEDMDWIVEGDVWSGK